MVNHSTRKIASPAEILRSHQRDHDFISQIGENINELLHRYSLHRTRFLKSDVPAKLLYFIVTSGLGNQTLGEEYTGIVQANITTFRVPSLFTRILAAVLECFGEQTLSKILATLQLTLNGKDLTPQAKSVLNTFFNKLRKVLPVFILAHRALFYIYGRYYSIGKRLVGIDYVKVYGPKPNNSISYGLRILGFATIAQCIFRLWQSRNLKDEAGHDEKEFESSSCNYCQLCLEKSSDTTTPCGHLFCWTCLAEWLRARNKCPLCRESVAPSRIIRLMNL